MFLFLRKRRLLGYVGKSLPTLPDRIRQMTPVERGACLALANATLLSFGHDRGHDLARAPHRLPSQAAVDMGFMLVEAREATLSRLDGFGDGVDGDVLAQALRQVLTYEIVLATVSTSLDPEIGVDVRLAWRLLAEGRRARNGAVEALTRFFRSTGAFPLPLVAGRAWTVGQLRALVTQVPPFMGVAGKKAA